MGIEDGFFFQSASGSGRPLIVASSPVKCQLSGVPAATFSSRDGSMPEDSVFGESASTLSGTGGRFAYKLDLGGHQDIPAEPNF